MHIAARQRLAHARWALVVAFAAALLLVLLPAQTASAHSPLESSTPEAGTHIATMPTQIELRFGAPVQDAGAVVVLADEEGNDWTAGGAIAGGTVVSAAVEPGAPDGRYEIRWSVVSADGAPMSGVVRFTLGTAATAANPLDAVMTAMDTAWVLVGAGVVVGALLVYMGYGLITVYGRPHRRVARSEPPAGEPRRSYPSTR